MIIDCISDLHGYFPELEGGDLLIIGGDITAWDLPYEWKTFNDWLINQKYKKIILIAGNHDYYLAKKNADRRFFSVGEYLMDAGTTYEGLKIWGSPWTPTFHNWAFMKDRGPELRAVWDKIPLDTDILITHGPPCGILDEVDGKNVGCEELRIVVEKVKPKVHIFGHIHGGYGQMTLKCPGSDVKCFNCSLMNGDYESINKPTRIEL